MYLSLIVRKVSPMVALEQELIERITKLNEDQKRLVLDFVREIDQPKQTTYTAVELMKLPYEERNRLVVEALQRSQNDDIEVLEAFDDLDFDEEGQVAYLPLIF